MRKLELIQGQVVNKFNILFISDTNDTIEPSGRKRRTCIFKCHCGKLFNSRLGDVLKNKRSSCGCKKGAKPKSYKNGDIINGIKFIKSCGTRKRAQIGIFECPLCKREWKSLIGNIQAGNTKSCCNMKKGWSRSQWVAFSKRSIFYKIRLYNDNESFIKIGITAKSVEHRYKSLKGYKFEILKTIEGESGYIYDLENRFKRIFKEYRYTPLIPFGGMTECFKEKK